MPRPARRTGTMPSFLPLICFPVVGATGVSMAISSSGKSRVISYPMSIVISSSKLRKSVEPVSFFRISVTLC